MSKEKAFQTIYPFTTEVIDGYIGSLDLQGKSLLTVGSSLDQAFNASLQGVGKITVFDINPFVKDYYKIKKDCILKYPRKKFFKKIIEDTPLPLSSDIFGYRDLVFMNTYMKNDENYEKLREKLAKDELDIEFIEGNVFAMDESLKDRTFDRIILSNVLQYIDYFAKGEDPYEFLRRNFETYKKHLNDDGLLQLFYYYGYSSGCYCQPNAKVTTFNLVKTMNALGTEGFYITCFPNSKVNNMEDAIVYYKKKGK